MRLQILVMLFFGVNPRFGEGFFEARVSIHMNEFKIATAPGTKIRTPTVDRRARASMSRDEETEEVKFSYRNARNSDLSEIAMLLTAVFEDDEIETTNVDDEAIIGSDLGRINSNIKDNTFMWDSLREETRQSPEEQVEYIKANLAKRMVGYRDDRSSPHSFLVATTPSINEMNEDSSIIGFLEMGTMPSPIGGGIELPYIANVAVASTIRRKKVGSTLVRLATKIATKWCSPSSNTPPFLFLSVDRENHSALAFYKRLGFDKMKVDSKAKVYLGLELN